MSEDKLSNAIDEVQYYVDNHDPVPVYAFDALEEVLEAAWRYWDLDKKEEK